MSAVVTGQILSRRTPSGEANSLAQAAYEVIRTRIITLELVPGSVISEAELMVKLGFGRTPIREALRLLANEHLVEVYPRRGMFIAGVDVKNLAALSEVRGALEIMAAELAAKRSTPAERAITQSLIKEIDGIKGEPKMAKLILLDQRIHHHIYESAHNEFLASTLDQYYAHALRIWFMALDRVESLAAAIIEHRALLEAIRDNDPVTAGKAMKDHVEGFETAIRRIL